MKSAMIVMMSVSFMATEVGLAEGKGGDLKFHVMKLQSIEPEAAVDIVYDLDVPGVRVVPRKNTNQLVFHGLTQSVDGAVKMLSALDASVAESADESNRISCMVTVHLIAANRAPGEESALPEYLNSIEASLREDGLTNFELLGQFKALVKDGGRFASGGFLPASRLQSGSDLQIANGRDDCDGFRVRVAGSLMLEESGESAVVRFVNGLDSEGPSEGFSQETVATLPLGKDVILGVISTTIGTSDTCIIVARATLD